MALYRKRASRILKLDETEKRLELNEMIGHDWPFLKMRLISCTLGEKAEYDIGYISQISSFVCLREMFMYSSEFKIEYNKLCKNFVKLIMSFGLNCGKSIIASKL